MVTKLEGLHPTLARWYRDLLKRHGRRSSGLWRLPPEYAFAHDYCFFLNDTLGHLIREAETANALSVTIDLTRLAPEVRAEMADGDLKGDALASWLEQHGYQDAINDLTERHVIAAVVSDAAQFIYEALRCSEKGKLVVTFALLRKPLRENLLLLELLLADRERFLQQPFDRGLARRVICHEQTSAGKQMPADCAAMWVAASRFQICADFREKNFSLHEMAERRTLHLRVGRRVSR
jgi:hypothetical protein